ncbi:unnamed protein product [Cylicocyclus nassatus]|uniref:Zinc transporter ZIP9 n=1 Tax=Cylicocyclus nassatus TaxID=53992 RepID=A0AA36DPQ3_CYLNA|nr:unnamed protein product [Cylicocyclus nassatus]
MLRDARALKFVEGVRFLPVYARENIMEGIGFLTVLSGSMFIGSYVAGAIPMMFNMSESRMRMVSIFGAGLLLGTALSVIIPEGIEALYDAKPEATHVEFHGIVNPAKAKAILEDTKPKGEPPRIVPADIEQKINAVNQANARKKRSPGTEVVPSNENSLRIKREAGQAAAAVADHAEHADHEHEHEHDHSAHHKIGYSLVFGFIFMLLVDQISNTAGIRNVTQSPLPDDRSGRNRMGISATIGLIVHAAADGIALGSASTIHKSDVQLIVFIAIMLHKAPAAFGLVSFLLMEGIDIRNVRKHLLVFSCAAPFAAMATFLLVTKVGSESISSSGASTGLLMLFSAGTFLYVATVHVLPELANRGKTTNMDYTLVVDAQSPATAGHSHSGGTSFTIKELAAIITGAIVPAILASGHSH